MKQIIKVVIQKDNKVLFCLSNENKWIYPIGIVNNDEELSDAVSRIALIYTNINVIPKSILKKIEDNKEQILYYFNVYILQENNFIPNNFSKKLKWVQFNNFLEDENNA